MFIENTAISLAQDQCQCQCSTLGSIIQHPECIIIEGDGADSVQTKSHVIQLL